MKAIATVEKESKSLDDYIEAKERSNSSVAYDLYYPYHMDEPYHKGHM